MARFGECMNEGSAETARRFIIAGIAGNIMEWYDFAVYGYFAQTIGQHFFPSKDPIASLIAAFGVFAAGCLMRPVGGLVFGHIGDRMGRKGAHPLSDRYGGPHLSNRCSARLLSARSGCLHTNRDPAFGARFVCWR